MVSSRARSRAAATRSRMLTTPGRTRLDEDRYSHASRNSSFGESRSIAREQELLQVLPAGLVNLPPAEVGGDLAQVIGAGLLAGTVAAQLADGDSQLLRQSRHHGIRCGGHVVRDIPFWQ